MSASVAGIPEHEDLTLLEGLRFRCRPDCGLCCFATPAASAEERGQLLQLKPAATFDPGSAGFWLLRARPGGGACQLLEGARCRGHPARPFPCQSYPLSVHLGERIQPTAVLACPGLDLEFLHRFGRGGEPLAPPAGLESEWASVRRELAVRPVAQWLRESTERLERARRRFRRAGLAFDLASARAKLWTNLPWPGPSDFPSPVPPGVDAAWEDLPLYQDDHDGIVGLRGVPDGWEVVGFRERGGGVRSLAIVRPPTRVPELSEGARTLLEGYLRYVAARDVTWWSLLEAAGRQPRDSLESLATHHLRGLGAVVLSRASVRAAVRGLSPGRLDAPLVELGIRATDAETLDRATLGRIL